MRGGDGEGPQARPLRLQSTLPSYAQEELSSTTYDLPQRVRIPVSPFLCFLLSNYLSPSPIINI